tara:strand:- start:36520 stop:37629 length:1110 start_codon:yes stop_codon:yes gene_type:complete
MTLSKPHRESFCVNRIALINPTKFLGNLLLSGQHIQHLAHWCAEQEIELLLVLDANFRDLFEPVFAGEGVRFVYYPRQALLPGARTWAGVSAWLTCVREIRAFKADLAFNIEEDSVCHRLTHFSGASRKVSSTGERYRFGFDQVLDIPRHGRPAGEESIWFVVRDVLQAVLQTQGLPTLTRPQYPDMRALESALPESGAPVDARPLAVLHAGASKAYKKWPAVHFAELANHLVARGYRIGLIGAGSIDAEVNSQVVAGLGVQREHCVDYCDRLDLQQLAALLKAADLMVGNDSGPSHLASALGVPGVVIFGPTDIGIWRPLGCQTAVLNNKQICQTDCTRHFCRSGFACLETITPQDVMNGLDSISSTS